MSGRGIPNGYLCQCRGFSCGATRATSPISRQSFPYRFGLPVIQGATRRSICTTWRLYTIPASNTRVKTGRRLVMGPDPLPDAWVTQLEQKVAHNGGGSRRSLSNIQDSPGDYEFPSTLGVICSSRRMSSGRSASGDPATQFPCWTISRTPQIAGSRRHSLLVRVRLRQVPAEARPRRLRP